MEIETRIETKVRAKAKEGFRVTARELEALEFVLDQKFANLDALYQRFYQSEGSKSSRYASERISLLVQSGFLKPVRVYTESKNYYLATELAQAAIQGIRPERSVQKPAESIDLRTFEHDKRVMLCRAHRERVGAASHWTSERRLKAELFAQGFDLSREYMPDAIYTNRAGGRVAFELELSPKSRERYAKKVNKFLYIMRHAEGLFQRTLYVTCSEPVWLALTDLTRPFQDVFKVMRFEEAIKPLAKGEGHS